MTSKKTSNQEIAGLMEGIASLLEIQHANPFKVRAYTNAANFAVLLPSVAQLLEVDAEYRKKAAAEKLKKIAPKRFNPGKVAWLPVLHTEKGDWSFTAMFSNTARAHELEKTDDWVVIFFEKNGFEGQSTVVTETSGALKGKRVVRGRETENRFFH